MFVSYRIIIADHDVFVRLCALFLQNSRMLIHWAALGGHDDLVRYLLSLDVPVDPMDDVRKHRSLFASVHVSTNEKHDINSAKI